MENKETAPLMEGKVTYKQAQRKTDKHTNIPMTNLLTRESDKEFNRIRRLSFVK